MLRALEGLKLPIERHTTGKIRASLIRRLKHEGWSGEIPIAPGSSNKLTGMCANVGLCVQTGNTAAIYRDLFKLIYTFQTGDIGAGIYVLPTRAAASVLGANYATMEHLVSELDEYNSVVPLPLLVIGFQGDN